jgi:predicted alpha/beta-hydrolase family hydrolase
MRMRTFAGAVLSSAALLAGAAACTTPSPGPGPITPTPPGDGGGGGGGGGGGSYAKGPNPTSSSTTSRGSFSVSTSRVSGASGFGGGQVYAPPAGQTYGGIILAPPFTVQNSANADTARFLASHGFVVLAYDANTAMDFPPARARQGEAAMRWLTSSSSVRDRVDSSRMAFGGFSMGGGATMEVANRTPSLKAAMPMVPWHSTKSFSNVRVPTLILAAQNDTVAGNSSHSKRFYASIPAGTPKTYVEDRGASHFMPMSLPGPLKRYAVSWMKRYVDNDTRYAPFLTQRDSSLSDWQQSGVN